MFYIFCIFYLFRAFLFVSKPRAPPRLTRDRLPAARFRGWCAERSESNSGSAPTGVTTFWPALDSEALGDKVGRDGKNGLARGSWLNVLICPGGMGGCRQRDEGIKLGMGCGV